MATSMNSRRFFPNHVAICQQRWERALDAEGFDSAVIHAGSQIIHFLDDYHYPFRPNPHFVSWLPLHCHDESVLIIRPGKRPRLYYYQPDDYWYSPPADPESWWADQFDLLAVTEKDAWRKEPTRGRVAHIGDAPALQGSGHLNPAGLIHRLHIERTRKTDYEIDCMEAASALAVRAHLAAEQSFLAGGSEYDIHQAYCREGGLLDDELPYGNIVALNQHGAVLHYQNRDRESPAERYSFLIDAGACVQGYAADITRTYAAHAGEFSELIQAMDTVQQDLCVGMQVGVDYRAMHLEAHRRIAGVLEDFSLIRCSADDAVESGLSSVFFPHGLGHYLGIQTHDVAGLLADESGEEIPRPEGHPFLRLTRILEAGNVLTVEPGLYFIKSLLQRWKMEREAELINWDAVSNFAPYGGVRIEDNVQVTEEGPRNLTREAFAVSEQSIVQ